MQKLILIPLQRESDINLGTLVDKNLDSMSEKPLSFSANKGRENLGMTATNSEAQFRTTASLTNAQSERARKSWRKLSTVLHSIIKLKHSDTKEIHTPRQLETEIHKSPRRASNLSGFYKGGNVTREAISSMRKQELIHKLITDGKADDLPKLFQILNSDPTKNMHHTDNQQHIYNRQLWNQQRPIYVACKYGNL